MMKIKASRNSNMKNKMQNRKSKLSTHSGKTQIINPEFHFQSING